MTQVLAAVDSVGGPAVEGRVRRVPRSEAPGARASRGRCKASSRPSAPPPCTAVRESPHAGGSTALRILFCFFFFKKGF